MVNCGGCFRFCYRAWCERLPRRCGTPFVALTLLFDAAVVCVLYAILANYNGGIAVFLPNDFQHFSFEGSYCDIVLFALVRVLLLMLSRCFTSCSRRVVFPAIAASACTIYVAAKAVLHVWGPISAVDMPAVLLFCSPAFGWLEVYMWYRTRDTVPLSHHSSDEDERLPLLKPAGNARIGPVAWDQLAARTYSGRYMSINGSDRVAIPSGGGQTPSQYSDAALSGAAAASGAAQAASQATTAAAAVAAVAGVKEVALEVVRNPFVGHDVARVRQMAQLDAKQSAALDDVIARVRQLTIPDDQLLYWDAPMIHRFLCARDYVPKKACAMIEETMKWRSEYRPDLITPESVKSDGMSGKVYTHGTDKFGRPVMYMRNAKDTDNTPDEKFRYVVYTLEQAIAAMEPNVEKMVWIIDLKDMSSKMISFSNIKMNLRVLNLLQNHYPERLGCAIFFNQPWVFNTFWSAIKKVLHEKTCRKVLFVKKSTALQQLAEVFDLQTQLEVEYGGSDRYMFNPQTWMAEEMAVRNAADRKRAELLQQLTGVTPAPAPAPADIATATASDDAETDSDVFIDAATAIDE